MIRVLYNTAASTLETVNVRPVQRTANNTVNLIDRLRNIYLIYFRSDMTGRVSYIYADKGRIQDFGLERANYQWSEIQFKQVNKLIAEDVYSGDVYLNPAGYWYYIIYEVHFPEGSEITWDSNPFSLLKPGYAPIDDIGTYEEWEGDGPEPSADNMGVLGIAVEEGKMKVNQVPPEGGRYTEHTQTNDNYIYTD